MFYRSLDELLELPAKTVWTALRKGVDSQYTPVTIAPKKRVIRRPGHVWKVRTGFKPHKDLKRIHKTIAQLISWNFAAHPIAYAYEKGPDRGPIENARQHIGAKSVLSVDLTDFFGSISQKAVERALRWLFSEFGDRNVRAMAKLCCYNGHLAQGSPVAPILSNLVCYSLDKQLAALALSYGCTVTRYSDDISFSTSALTFPAELARICQGTVELGQPITSLLEPQGFAINVSKLKLQTWEGCLKVTGSMVGADGVRVPKAFKHNLRSALHRLEKDGIDDAAREALCSSIGGCIAYIGQVEGRDSGSYLRPLEVFEGLRATGPLPAAQL